MTSLAKTTFEPSGENPGELSVALVLVSFLNPPPEAFAVHTSAFPLEVRMRATFEPSRENDPPVLLPLNDAKTFRVLVAKSMEYKSMKPVLK